MGKTRKIVEKRVCKMCEKRLARPNSESDNRNACLICDNVLEMVALTVEQLEETLQRNGIKNARVVFETRE